MVYTRDCLGLTDLLVVGYLLIVLYICDFFFYKRKMFTIYAQILYYNTFCSTIINYLKIYYWSKSAQIQVRLIGQILCAVPLGALIPFFPLIFESTIICACFLIRYLFGMGFSSWSLFANSTTSSSNDHSVVTSWNRTVNFTINFRQETVKNLIRMQFYRPPRPIYCIVIN